MTTGVAPSLPKFQFFNSAGVPLVNGTVDVYLAGTTTRTDTWQDSALTTLNTNPIVLDSGGRCDIWLDPNVTYKFVLKSALSVTEWTLDNIPGAAGADQISAIDLDDYDALRAYDGNSVSAYVTGYDASGPSGISGHFVRDDSDTTTADDDGITIVDANSKRWKRQYTGDVDVAWYGAVGDGTTDDTDAFVAADEYAAANGRQVYVDASKEYYISGFEPGAAFVSPGTVTFTNVSIPVYRPLNYRESESALGLEENDTEILAAASFTSTTSITVAEASDLLTFTKTGGSPSAQIPEIVLPGTDWVFYCKVKQSSGALNELTNIVLGPSGSPSMTVSLGYNWVTSAAVTGTISCRWNATDKVLLTGQTLTDYTYLVLHYDSNFECLNVYTKNSTTKAYTFVATVSGAFTYTNEFRVTFGGSSSNGLICTMDTRMFCKPNIISIGDSICSGSTLFSPNPSSADKDYTSCWQSYVQLTEVENTLVINKGIGGQNSSQINGRISSDVVAHQPAVCVLHLSTNDYGAGYTYTQRTDYTQSSINLLTAASIRCTLLSSIYPNSNATSYPLNTEYYQEFMTDSDGFPLLTGYSEFIDFMTNGLGNADNELSTGLAQSDGVHPTPGGYAVIGGLIEDAFSSSTAKSVNGSLEVTGSLFVDGLIYGTLADRSATRPFGWAIFSYDNANTEFDIVSLSTNPENTAIVSIERGSSADDVEVTFNKNGIAPAGFFTQGTGAAFFGVARLVNIVQTGDGENRLIRYALRKLDGTTPTGVELDGTGWLIYY